MCASSTTNVFNFDPASQTLLDAEVAALRSLSTGDFTGVSPDIVGAFRELRELGTFASVKIPGSDPGVLLDAGVYAPRTSGPHPVVIMPAPLAPTGWESYPGMLLRFALKGYVALAYSERGLAKSTGLIDVAGPADCADGSKVIDWVLATYPQADPDRIGFAGSSYGAGQSLLIAAHDDRVTAVCAQSAWGDLGRGLYENETRHLKAFEALAGLFGEARLSKEAAEVFADFRANRNIPRLLAFAALRSPLTHVGKLNARNVPVFLGTYWHETIFSTAAVVELFSALTGPKRLLVQIGDHGGDELLGFLGGISRASATTYRWLERFVIGTENGVELEGDVHTEQMHDLLSVGKQSDWESYVLPPARYYLNPPATGAQDGVMSSQPGVGGTQSFTAGKDTPALIAPALVQTGIAERLARPVEYATRAISREDAAVWSTPAFPRPQRITGAATLHLTVTAAAPTATLVAHLFDLDPRTGTARIVTSAPFTLLNDRPGQTRTIDIRLQPADYRVAAGNQLQLVVDTHDDFFDDSNVAGTTITIVSQDRRSYLDLPVGAV